MALILVALRKESVDRNLFYGDDLTFADVALRKESVDRNTNFSPASLFGLPVALRKESVDRNPLCLLNLQRLSMSLSARRAWIEIVMQEIAQQRKQVALRKESVDRNFAVGR